MLHYMQEIPRWICNTESAFGNQVSSTFLAFEPVVDHNKKHKKYYPSWLYTSTSHSTLKIVEFVQLLPWFNNYKEIDTSTEAFDI